MHYDFSLPIFAFVLAAASGVLMAVQGVMNSALGKVVGLMETTFIVHVIGTVAVAALLFVFKTGKGDFSLVGQAPWYSYLGGVISIFIIYLVAASIPKIGAANATTAIIVGQVLTAVAMDSLGIFGLEKIPFGWHQVIGIAFLAAGAKLLLPNL